MNTLIFDIETIADCVGYRRLNQLPNNLSDADTLAIMQQERLAEVGHTFHRHPLHQIACISLLLIQGDKIKLWTLGRPEENAPYNEKETIQRFFAGIERLEPTLISWNGSGFDLPVLHYRALMHQISAPRYFEIDDRDYRYNNYLSRFHWRHIDLMDVLSGFQAQSRASLNDIAKLCRFPGKLETDGSQVQDLWQQGQHHAICDYCETDVLNTYLIYLRFELLRGKLDNDHYQQKINQLKTLLKQQKSAHLQEFLNTWQHMETQ